MNSIAPELSSPGAKGHIAFVRECHLGGHAHQAGRGELCYAPRSQLRQDGDPGMATFGPARLDRKLPIDLLQLPDSRYTRREAANNSDQAVGYN